MISKTGLKSYNYVSKVWISFQNIQIFRFLAKTNSYRVSTEIRISCFSTKINIYKPSTKIDISKSLPLYKFQFR